MKGVALLRAADLQWPWQGFPGSGRGRSTAACESQTAVRAEDAQPCTPKTAMLAINQNTNTHTERERDRERERGRERERERERLQESKTELCVWHSPPAPLFLTLLVLVSICPPSEHLSLIYILPPQKSMRRSNDGHLSWP